jgi:hypothetical protein
MKNSLICGFLQSELESVRENRLVVGSNPTGPTFGPFYMCIRYLLLGESDLNWFPNSVQTSKWFECVPMGTQAVMSYNVITMTI